MLSRLFSRNSQEILLELTKREISVRYKKTIFGFLWMFLNPLFQMMIIGLVFGSFITLSDHVDNYFIYVFIGLLIWNFFSNTISKNTSIYINEGALLHKSNFPRELVVLSVVASNGFHLIISKVVLISYLLGYYLFSSQIFMVQHLFLQIPLLIFLLLLIFTLTIGLSFLLSAINVKYRDTAFFVTAFMPLWFYASPIVWELRMLPESWHRLAYLNPLVGIIEISRKYYSNIPITVDNGIYLSLLTIFVITFFGIVIFNKEKNFFDDWI